MAISLATEVMPKTVLSLERQTIRPEAKNFATRKHSMQRLGW